MTIRTKLSENDFISASLVSLRSNGRIKIIGVIFVAVCLFNLFNGSRKSGNVLVTILPLTIIVGLYAILYYFGLKKAYRRNSRLGETKNYTFHNDHVMIDAESYNMRLDWNKVKRVIKRGQWLFIYENEFLAHPIPRRDITDDELQQLRNTLTGSGVKIDF